MAEETGSMAKDRIKVSVSGGGFSFNITTDNAQVTRDLCITAVALGAIYAGCKLWRRRIDGALLRGFGGERYDQDALETRPGSLHVYLYCKTDERFLELLNEFESGRLKEYLEKEFCEIGIEIQGLKIEIENWEEVYRKREEIENRMSLKSTSGDLEEEIGKQENDEVVSSCVPAPSILGISESDNSVKLMRLIVDIGTEALRKVFLSIHRGNLQVVLSDSVIKSILTNLKGNNIIIQSQWNKLYPSLPKLVDIKEFDISLLSILLRNICSLSPPDSSVWIEPSPTDYSVEADITRVRKFRNEHFGHIPNTRVNAEDFKTFWGEMSSTLVRLGIDQKEIDRLCRYDSVLAKHLVKCDFEREIELHSQKLTEGTRAWVIEEVSAWFHDETSQSRAFVISGVAGMGKSVIAAVLCKRFAGHLGASHFFQYNNNQYNNSAILLQSIAFQLCEVLAPYKVALVEKLSGCVGESLKNMNTEALFTALLKEPLTNLVDPGKHILIVLDALDEGEYHGKQKVAHLISHHFHKLPSYMRFVITTRPEKNLINRFQNLNPLFIEAWDKRNLNDMKLFLQNRISSTDLVDRIAQTSDGLMLYAFLLSEFCKDAPLLDGLPNGLEGFYEIYFKRLENELQILEISEEKFLSFLSVLAAARGPLPLEFVGILFGLNNNVDTKRQLNKIFNSLSSLLVIKEDQTISHFHKSLSDWLVDTVEHDYTADVEFGHQFLFDLCIQKFHEMKKNDVRFAIQNNVSVKYALSHYLLHMLNALFDPEKMKSFVSSYVADIEVMFASVLLDVDLTLNNINTLMNDESFKKVPKETFKAVNKLYSLIKKFAFFLRDYPETFLSHVVNEGGKELSSKALILLQMHYKDIVYFELVEKSKAEDAVEARCLLSGRISGIDVSPMYDYVVCSYSDGGIELFSLGTAKSEWKIDDFVEVPELLCGRLMLPHCIVFHPNQTLILPGRLDQVLTLEGTIATGPFQVDEAYSKFTNCCFSPDGCTLVTNYGHILVVWDTSSGIQKVHLACKDLLSLLFTASGQFFGTTDVDNVFCIYDATSDYGLVDYKKLPSMQSFEILYRPMEIISAGCENSWFLSDEHNVYSLVADSLTLNRITAEIKDIVLPTNLYHGDELQLYQGNPQHSWFPKVKQVFRKEVDWSPFDALRYISLQNNDILVFTCESVFIHIVDKSLLKKGALSDNKNNVFSNISIEGDFVYLNDPSAGTITVCNLETKEQHTLQFQRLPQSSLPLVRNGVILYGQNHTPQLWNCDLSHCLACLDELVGAKDSMSASEELIVFVYESSIAFFNVFLRKVERQIDFSEPVQVIEACSVQYDALVQMKFTSKFTLWKDGKCVEGWTKNLEKYICSGTVSFAQFSPDGNWLAMCCGKMGKLVIFDMISLTFLPRVFCYGPGNDFLCLQFYDNENLVCCSKNHMLYMVNVKGSEILTCFDLGDIPYPISVSREKIMVFASYNKSKKFELIKVCFPRTG